MKKHLLLFSVFLLCVTVTFGQHKIRDEYWGDSFPQHTPSYSNALHIDTVGKKVYRYKKRGNEWVDETQKWKHLYLKAEVKKSVTITDAATDSLNEIALRTAESEGYRAVTLYANMIFCHPRGNADIKPETGKTYDQINLQQAIRWSQHMGRRLVTLKADYYVASGLKIDKYNPYCFFDFGDARLIATNSLPFTFIYSEKANDSQDANIQIERKPYIQNLRIKGQGNTQTGINLGATYGAVYSRIYGENLDWNIVTEFGLMSLIENCFSTNCDNGWHFSIGTYPGATWSNSQSNSSIARGCRFYGNTTGTAFKATHSSGIVFENCIVEGFKVGSAFELHAPSNTVCKEFTVRNMHIELVNGTDKAVVSVNWAGGFVLIDKLYSSHPTLMTDIQSNPGYSTVSISNIPYWKALNGKVFYNRCCTSYNIINCDNPIYGNDLTDLFDGRDVYMRCGQGVGYDSVCVTPIPR